MMKKEMIWRVGLYAFGMWILAVGAVLGNRTGIGVFAINAIPFAVSEAFDISFATMNLLFYCMFIVLQFILRGKEHRRWRDLLQLPASFAFSALLEVVDRTMAVQAETFAESILFLAICITVTAIGIPLTIRMQIVPNAPDGFLEVLSWKLNRDIGLTKNIEDGVCLAVAFLIDLLFGTVWTSVGLGTAIIMILLGRMVSLFDRLFGEKVSALAGLKGIHP